MKKLLLVGLFFIANSAFAEDVATVLFASNKVTVIRNNSEIAVMRGAKLAVGDAIKTGAKSGANIKYNNGTLINLGDNSNYKILAYNPTSKDVEINAELTQGKLKLKTTGHSKEVLNTPIIALAILGTEFKLALSSDRININVSSGKIRVGSSVLPTDKSLSINRYGDIVEAEFPKEGEVKTSPESDGYIESSDSSVSSDTSDTSASSSSSDSTTPTTEGMEVVSAITTTQVASDASIPPEASTSLISIDCFAGAP